MTRLPKLMFAVIAVAFGLFLASPASAQYPSTPTITVDKPTVPSGETVIISGTGYPANCTVELTTGGQVIGTTTSDAEGNWSFPWDTTGVAPGTYEVTGACDGVSLAVMVNVTEATSGGGGGGGGGSGAGSLPVTGSSNTLTYLGVGLGLVAAGGLVVLVTRKRNGTAHAA